MWALLFMRNNLYEMFNILDIDRFEIFKLNVIRWVAVGMRGKMSIKVHYKR